MTPCKPLVRKIALFVFVFAAISFNRASAQDGKQLFNGKCASCHQIFKDATGPALMGLEERHTWSDHNEILKWAHNPTAYMAKDPYTAGLKAKYGSVMQAFPDLTLKEVDAIVGYINQEVANKNKAPEGPVAGMEAEQKGNKNAIIFGVISLILAIIALILMQVNSNLKKLSDDQEGILRPEPVPFYRNKIYIALVAIILFVVGGYYLSKGAIGLGRQKGYEPRQPIFYSHKVHAGINQINCLYCHGGAWESKHATVPSVNICMNCHKAIQEYAKGPQLYDAEGNEINGTQEIQKLYKAAGFDPSHPNDWDPSKAQPIEWIKIHNLPDHVFFSHAQHVRAGKVQCQTCHGEITAMDEVKQVSELSMGWCINCHRQTKVDFNYTDSTGNKFYSLYEKFHEDIKSGKMDSVTVKDIGGLECQRCHY
ncbi:MAG TPA: c-type cytochrome [Chitinophagaceae bacterium]|jgi:mono/diheme cytochrome c family protein|nr:c-type cytochrome [Chitinophagaceae bacterium]